MHKKGALKAENNRFIGISRVGKITKLHAAAESLGNPVHFLLSGGQVHDTEIATDVLSGIDISGNNIIGDKAYRTEKIRTYITEHNTDYTIRHGIMIMTLGFAIFALSSSEYCRKSAL